jgi:CheY-like chemotaxis protein
MSGAVLLVEDSKRDAEAIEVLLRSVGVSNQVIAVHDGAQAIAYLNGDDPYSDRQKFPFPSVLLLDLRMPEIDGFDVLEWIKSQPQLNQFLIVVLSAYDGIREVTHAYSLGAKSFLVKPCNRDDMKNLLKSFPEYWIQSVIHSETPSPDARV